jgi:hypothetical protein
MDFHVDNPGWNSNSHGPLRFSWWECLEGRLLAGFLRGHENWIETTWNTEKKAFEATSLYALKKIRPGEE